MLTADTKQRDTQLAAMLRWFTAGGAIRIAVRQFSQTWKLHHYDYKRQTKTETSPHEIL